jgi:hypothetical protein
VINDIPREMSREFATNKIVGKMTLGIHYVPGDHQILVFSETSDAVVVGIFHKMDYIGNCPH